MYGKGWPRPLTGVPVRRSHPPDFCLPALSPSLALPGLADSSGPRSPTVARGCQSSWLARWAPHGVVGKPCAAPRSATAPQGFACPFSHFPESCLQGCLASIPRLCQEECFLLPGPPKSGSPWDRLRCSGPPWGKGGPGDDSSTQMPKHFKCSPL